MVVDYGFYKRVMEFLAQYLGLANEVLRMDVVDYQETINGVKVLVSIHRLRNNEVIYCTVNFDNAIGRAEPTCSKDKEYIEKIYREM